MKVLKNVPPKEDGVYPLDRFMNYHGCETEEDIKRLFPGGVTPKYKHKRYEIIRDEYWGDEIKIESSFNRKSNREQLEEEAVEELRDDSVCECEIEDNKVKTATKLKQQDGETLRVTIKEETKLTVKVERVENIVIAYHGNEGNFSFSTVNNKMLQKGLASICEKKQDKIGLQLKSVFDALVANMSMNNAIADSVNATWLDEHCPFIGMRFITHKKPLQMLIDEDLIAMNNKKQIMVNPLFAIKIAPTEKNLLKIQEMYFQFKDDGKLINHFNKRHPTEK